MEGLEYIYEMCESLPRAGPGGNEHTRRAYESIPDLPPNPLILDIGCGPGVQTLELARLSNGTVTALDNHQPFLDRVMVRARQEGLEDRVSTINRSMMEMEFEDESFDIVWAEGALYIMGFRSGLQRCRRLLKPGGCLAVTELAYTTGNPPLVLTQYLEQEYPDAQSIGANIALIRGEGFDLLTHFTLPPEAWMDDYYAPMERVLSCLIEKYQGNKTALAVFDAFQGEIEIFRKYHQHFSYEFFVMQKPRVSPA